MVAQFCGILFLEAYIFICTVISNERKRKSSLIKTKHVVKQAEVKKNSNIAEKSSKSRK